MVTNFNKHIYDYNFLNLREVQQINLVLKRSETERRKQTMEK